MLFSKLVTVLKVQLVAFLHPKFYLPKLFIAEVIVFTRYLPAYAANEYIPNLGFAIDCRGIADFALSFRYDLAYLSSHSRSFQAPARRVM